MMMMLCLLALLLNIVSGIDSNIDIDVDGTSTFSFLAVGDWGGAALDTQAYDNVYAVSAQMAKTATKASPKFILGIFISIIIIIFIIIIIIGTGDNFYWCGIQNTSDFQVPVDWTKPYTNAALDLDWYQILGNHEYGYNVSAQIDLANTLPRWIMDDRYYTKRIQASSNVYISLIFLDTSPCVTAYRVNNSKGWDPCSSQYPTCSQQSTDDDFEGQCYFYQNIMSQDCKTQYDWFQQQLDAVPADDWLIVSGHHPIDEADVEDFTTALQKRGFSIYFNGHVHSLQQYTLDYKGAYVTTGAGSLVNTVDQTHPKTVAKLNGEDINVLGESAAGTHSYQTVFSSITAGFNLNTFSKDFSSLQVQYISYTGQVLHTFNVYKNGTTF